MDEDRALGANTESRQGPLTSVALSDDELAVLDGRCSDKVQEKVTGALDRITARSTYTHLDPPLAGFVADVVTEGRTTGRVIWQASRIRRCPLCGKHAGYVHFKSGPRRGKPNYDRPLTLAGHEAAWRFVSVRGTVSVGGCDECVVPLVPLIQEALRGVRAEVAAPLRAAGEPVRKRHERRGCPKCGWQGHEGEMRRLPTVLGDGTYPGGCPACPFESRFLGREKFELLDGFDVVEVES